MGKKKKTEKGRCTPLLDTPPGGKLPSTGNQVGLTYILLSLLAIAVVGALIYSNTLHASWHFDDHSAIVENYAIRNLKNTLLGGGSRWVGFASFALNYHFGKLNVLGYHLVNICIHIINAILVYFLVLLTFTTPPLKETLLARDRAFLSLACGLLFVAHPIQTQAVTYITQRFTSLATLFYLLSLLLFIKARFKKLEGKKWYSPLHLTYYGGALLAAFLAMKTKEITITLPASVLLYEFSFFSPTLKALTRKLLYLIPLLLTFFIIPFSLYGSRIVGLSGGTFIGLAEVGDVIGEATQETTALSRTEYLFTQFNVIVTYIRLLFFPINQNLDYDYPISHTFFEYPTFFSFLFLISIALFGGWMFNKSRLIFFGIFWFFITLSVESSIIPIRDVIFEHRLYLPSVGFVIAITIGIYQMMEEIKIKKTTHSSA